MFAMRIRGSWSRALVALAAIVMVAGCGKSPTKPTVVVDPPKPPTQFTVVAGEANASLQWKNPASGDFVAAILRRSDQPLRLVSDGIEIYRGPGDRYVDVGLHPGSTYHYAVWAQFKDGSFAGPVVASAVPAEITPPPVPARLGASAGTRSVHLTWDAVVAPVERVVLVRKLGGYPASPTDGAVVYQGAGTSCDDGDLAGRTAVYYSLFNMKAGLYSGAAHAAATPAAELMTVSLPGGTVGRYWVQHTYNGVASGAGDCEFNGNGPIVSTHVWVERVGTAFALRLKFRARETTSDWTCGEIGYATPWSRTLGSVPAGWNFDGFVNNVDCTWTYTDTNTSNDTASSPSALVTSWRVQGDSDGNDVCGTAADDTGIVGLTYQPVLVRVWR